MNKGAIDVPLDLPAAPSEEDMLLSDDGIDSRSVAVGWHTMESRKLVLVTFFQELLPRWYLGF